MENTAESMDLSPIITLLESMDEAVSYCTGFLALLSGFALVLLVFYFFKR